MTAKREIPQFPRHVGPTPGHLLECLVVAEWDRTLNQPWSEKWPPEGIYCTCDDWSPEQ